MDRRGPLPRCWEKLSKDANTQGKERTMANVEIVNGAQAAMITAGTEGPAGYLAYIGVDAIGGRSWAVIGSEELLVSPHAYAPEGATFPTERLYDLLAGAREPRSVSVSAKYGVSASRGACGVVTVCIDGTKAIPAGAQWTDIVFGTLPEGFRPAIDVNMSVECGGGRGIFSVLPNGNVKYVRASSSDYSEGVAASVAYCAA